jgi:hypothetical protein
MARPTKDPSELCKRWDTLYVTDAERASVVTSAVEANLSVSRYIMSLHARGNIINRSDGRRNIQLLTTVTRQLGAIAMAIGARRVSEDNSASAASNSLETAVSLLELERLIRDATMPWQSAQKSNDLVDEEGNLC